MEILENIIPLHRLLLQEISNYYVDIEAEDYESAVSLIQDLEEEWVHIESVLQVQGSMVVH